MKVVSLFSGIGGFEIGFQAAGMQTVLMCENDPSAAAVLADRLAGPPIHGDIKTLSQLPECDVLVAGWPCQDLSQAGRTAGIAGKQSGLVGEVFRLIDGAVKKPKWVLLENVAFALSLQGGRAVHEVVKALGDRGYRWAYRILDSQYFGLPQRRRRIFICASLEEDPRRVLFDGGEAEGSTKVLSEDDVGFYWTEGNRGVGWTSNAIPPLKGGSSVSIPSPPAIWHVSSGKFSTPSIEDAERLQGFPAGWTAVPDGTRMDDRNRWRLVGNAVSVPVARWIASRVVNLPSYQEQELAPISGTSHNAAWGLPAGNSTLMGKMPEGSRDFEKVSLRDFGLQNARPLSLRAATGFAHRYARSSLRIHQKFLNDLHEYCESLK